VAADASIGCTGRVGVNSIARSPSRPDVSATRAALGSDPANIDARRPCNGGCHHAVECTLSQFAGENRTNQQLLGFGRASQEIGEQLATSSDRAWAGNRTDRTDRPLDVSDGQ
jgi:hypothetical protein